MSPCARCAGIAGALTLIVFLPLWHRVTLPSGVDVGVGSGVAVGVAVGGGCVAGVGVGVGAVTLMTWAVPKAAPHVPGAQPTVGGMKSTPSPIV